MSFTRPFRGSRANVEAERAHHDTGCAIWDFVSSEDEFQTGLGVRDGSLHSFEVPEWLKKRCAQLDPRTGLRKESA